MRPFSKIWANKTIEILKEHLRGTKVTPALKHNFVGGDKDLIHLTPNVNLKGDLEIDQKSTEQNFELN